MSNQIIGTRFVLRNYPKMLNDAIHSTLQAIGMPTVASYDNTGIVCYVDDDGITTTSTNPSSKENNPERETLEFNDGNLSAFFNAIQTQREYVKKNAGVTFTVGMDTVTVRPNGSIKYGCTTLTADVVDLILEKRRNVMK